MCFVACLWYWFALPYAARIHKRRFFSPHSTNYFPNSAAAPLHCTAQTKLCTVYVTIRHVPLLSHTEIYSIFLQLLKTHMAFRMLHFLVSNGNATTVSGHVLQILHFYHRCCHGETISVTECLLQKDSKLLYNIRQKKSKF